MNNQDDPLSPELVERWNTEDLHPVRVSPNRRFSKIPNGPIAFCPSVLGGRIVGYIWFRDEDKAAGFVARDDAESDGANASVSWAAALLEAKVQGLSPSQAVTHLQEATGDAISGRLQPGNFTTAPSLEALRTFARDAEPEPE